ncbi:MAG: TM0106 family RecB-like putative nuclease, partial [Cyanobium sp.]
RSWLRCRRRAWLDRHGPAEARRWSAHRALALQDQLSSFQTLLPQRPGHGEEACRRGDPGVVGVRLRGEGPGGLRLEAHPPLLHRLELASRWGSHAYQPVMVRQGRHLTREHRLVLALWGRLLEGHQQAPVPQALVLAGAGNLLQRERLSLGSGLRSQLDDTLARLAAELEPGRPTPPLVNDRKKCTLCSWRGLCDAEAARDGHLSEVSGIGGKRRDLLLSLGITTLAELAASDPEQLAASLEEHGEQHRDVAAQLVAQARAQAGGLRQRILAGPALPELENAPGVLIYDIESDSDARDDFLHGLVRLQRAGAGWPGQPEAATAPYHPVLALQEHGEERLWRRLRTLLARHADWPVLHYGETEAVGLLRLAERQGASETERQQLRRRLIDVHQRLRRHWLLPVNSYGLKSVASWRGFHWSQEGVDGARCLLWWRQWRRDRDRPGVAPRLAAQPLARIFRYNRDDSLATWAVARWLLEQDGAAGPADQAA